MLKIQVSVPPPSMDAFDFNDARPLPFLSAPSTPKGFGHYSLSAPTSPSRISEFYDYFDQLAMMNREITESNVQKGGSEDDFAFDFSAELEKTSLTADELFDGGKIRPLKLPPGLQGGGGGDFSPSASPRSPIQQGKKMIRSAFSPRRSKDLDPFAVAVEITRNRAENERGRERTSSSVQRTSSRRAARSVSPLRVSEYPWEEEEKQAQRPTKHQSALIPSTPSASTPSPSKTSSRKWRLKDFLLFRSASEGRAHDKDPFRLFRRHDDGKDASFRSTDSSGSSSSKRKGQVSAHELHYTVNKAVSQNMKKKTFLPYKQGILGRLAFNPAAHALANGFGSITR